jgi:hypothetical protein
MQCTRLTALVFLYLGVSSLAMMIGGDAVMANFIYTIMGGKAFAVGYQSSAMSVVSLITAGFAGSLYDLFPTSIKPLVSVSAFVIAIAKCVQWYAVDRQQEGEDGTRTLVFLVVTGACSAAAGQFVSTFFRANLANALPAGDARAEALTRLSQLGQGMFVVGRIATAVVSLRHAITTDGSVDYSTAEWTFTDLQRLVQVGAVLSLLSVFIITQMPEQPPPPRGAATLSKETENSETIMQTCLAESWLLLKLELADLGFTLVGGVLITFWPVYMVQALGMEPMSMQAAFIASTFLAMPVQEVNLRISKSGSRMVPIIATEVVATAALFGIVFCATTLEPASVAATASFSVLFVVRVLFRGCSAPLYDSLKLDMVPSHQRGRWTALGSVHNVANSAAAVIGGYLIDRYDFVSVFFGVAVLQTLSIVLLLLPITPQMNALEAELRAKTTKLLI